MEQETPAQSEWGTETLGTNGNLIVHTVYSAERAQTVDSEITDYVDIKLYDLDGVFNRNRGLELVMLNLEMAMLRWLQNEVLGGSAAKRYIMTSRQEIFRWSPWIALLKVALNPRDPLSVQVLSLTNPDVIRAVSEDNIPNVAIFTDSGKRAKERAILWLTKPFVVRHRKSNGHSTEVDINPQTFEDTLQALALSSERGLAFMDNDRTVFDVFLAIANANPDKTFHYININTSKEFSIFVIPHILRTTLLQITGISLRRLQGGAK